MLQLAIDGNEKEPLSLEEVGTTRRQGPNGYSNIVRSLGKRLWNRCGRFPHSIEKLPSWNILYRWIHLFSMIFPRRMENMKTEELLMKWDVNPDSARSGRRIPSKKCNILCNSYRICGAKFWTYPWSSNEDVWRTSIFPSQESDQSYLNSALIRKPP